MMKVMTSLLSELEQLTTMKERFANMEEALVDSMEMLDIMQRRLENQSHMCEILCNRIDALAGLMKIKLPPPLVPPGTPVMTHEQILNRKTDEMILSAAMKL
jgi:hypothetical protein